MLLFNIIECDISQLSFPEILDDHIQCNSILYLMILLPDPHDKIIDTLNSSLQLILIIPSPLPAADTSTGAACSTCKSCIPLSLPFQRFCRLCNQPTTVSELVRRRRFSECKSQACRSCTPKECRIL